MTNVVAKDHDRVDDTPELTHQYVTFQVADELFGFPMSSVLEIIRLPETVQVPLTPGALVGLANLRGSVLSILDLRRLLQFPDGDYGDVTRVIVVDAGTPVGLVVDRVARVMNVDAGAIETSDQVQSCIDAACLSGVIHQDQDEPLIQLLNFQYLIKQEFSNISIQAAQYELAASGAEPTLDDEEDENFDQIVSFLVDNQEYAFNLMEVEEIVRVPEVISQVPGVEKHVLGMIDLRGRLLPLVSMRRLFSLTEKIADENHRILVITLSYPGGRRVSVGLVVDDVREVFQINREELDDVPKLLNSQEGGDDIAAVCRLDDGKRLVSVLSAASLFRHPAIQMAVEARGNEEKQIEMIEEQLNNVTEDDDNTAQLVVFNLASQEFGISIDDVQEITRIPDQLDRVPKTPDFIEGMVNLRGMVLPVLDMRSRFEQPKCERSDRQRIVVLSLEGLRTGFIVDSVTEVLRIPEECIETAPSLSDNQARIMGHVVNLREDKRMIQVVTARELLSKHEIEEINESE